MGTKFTNTKNTKYKMIASDLEAKQAIKDLLLYIGENPEREGLKETPDRIVRMWKEMFRGYTADKPKITTFTNDFHSTDMIFDCGDYYSMCEHHILPFFGRYYFAYIPDANGKIIGLSKIARVVAYCSARLQLQEKLAREIVEMLAVAIGKAEGFALVLKGRHLCKEMRGVKSKGTMSVSYLTGVYKENIEAREEFYKLIELNK